MLLCYKHSTLQIILLVSQNWRYMPFPALGRAWSSEMLTPCWSRTSPGLHSRECQKKVLLDRYFECGLICASLMYSWCTMDAQLAELLCQTGAPHNAAGGPWGSKVKGQRSIRSNSSTKKKNPTTTFRTKKNKNKNKTCVPFSLVQDDGVCPASLDRHATRHSVKIN